MRIFSLLKTNVGNLNNESLIYKNDCLSMHNTIDVILKLHALVTDKSKNKTRNWDGLDKRILYAYLVKAYSNW